MRKMKISRRSGLEFVYFVCLFSSFSYSRPNLLVIFIFLIFQARPFGSVSAHSENKLGRGLISKTGEFLSQFHKLPPKDLQPFVRKYSKDLTSTHMEKVSAICFQGERYFDFLNISRLHSKLCH